MSMINNINFQTQRLSQFWTHQDVCDVAARRAGVTDNEIVELESIRRIVNECVSSVAEQLHLAKTDHYGWTLNANLDKNTPDNAIRPKIDGLYRITLADTPADLGDNVNGFAENLSNSNVHFYRYIRDVQRISINQPGGNITLNNVVLQPFRGNLIRKDFSELGNLASRYNQSSRYSIFWSRSGHSIHIYIGQGILVELNSGPLANTFFDYYANANILPNNTHKYILRDLGGNTSNVMQDTFGAFVIRCQRKPFLDNVANAPNAVGSTYGQPIDVPDEFAPLVVAMAHKSLLEYQRETVPQALAQEIAQTMNAIKGDEQLARDIERQEREKEQYGSPQKDPGIAG